MRSYRLFQRGQSLPIEYFTTKWFITLFAGVFAPSSLNKVLSLFVLKGLNVVFKSALSLLELVLASLLQCDFDQLSSFLSNLHEAYAPSMDAQLLQNFAKYKVTNRMLNQLETLYEQNKPLNVRLATLLVTEPPLLLATTV